MYMEKNLYKNIVFGILSWHKFAGTQVLYRTDLSQQFFTLGVISVNHRTEIIGAELSTYMEEFANEYGGRFVKDFKDDGTLIKGSVRIEF
ncbi:MAG: hypothetical protein EBU90_24765 [Proteobacteria bacterium]|nr:hypothetical protein [Pseudomonadota bacterium]